MVTLQQSIVKGLRMDINKVAFFTLDQVTTAIEHLRVLAPLKSAGIDVKRYVFDEGFNLESIDPCDMILIQRDFAGNYIKYEELLAYAKRHKKPVVLDLDDNLLELPLSHPDRQTLYYTESLTPLIQSMLEVDAITVTNKLLQKEAEKYNNAVFVLPNFLDDSLWQFKPQRASNNNEDIKILYMGSHSHRPDLDMITGALKSILNVYPNVQFYSYGLPLPKELAEHIRAHHLPTETVEYEKFAKRFNELDMDIAIAPLVSNAFNSYKSPLKFFEYSANALAGVYSDVEPYSSIIEHNKNGLLSKNDILSWVENIELLINNPSLREQLSNQAQELIRTEYLLSKNSYIWREAYENISRLVKETPKSISLSLTQLKDLNLQFAEQNNTKKNELINSQKQIETLQAQNGSLQTQNNSLQTQNDSLHTQNNSLQTQNDSLHTQNKSLQTQNDTLRIQCDTLDLQYVSLETQYATLEQNNDALKTQMVSLEEEKSNLANIIGQLTNEVNAYALSKSWRITRLFRKIKKRLQRR